MNGLTPLDPNNLPPLPAPWSQHVAPTGHLYYYNPVTKESTYNRPLSLASLLPNTLKKPKKKKEKPAKKTPIPDTAWLRVVTNHGNIFYSNKETRTSTWEIPEEIADAVAALVISEDDGQESDHAIRISPEPAAEQTGTKRKHREEDDEEEEERAEKRPKVDDTTIGVEDEDDDEWQRQAAEEMAKEEEKPQEPEVKLSTEEATTLLKSILRDKDVNPMLPWESSVAIFSQDERYAALNSGTPIALQHDIFEEYCKEVIKERKEQAAVPKAELSPLDAYRELLRVTVTSTRMTYTQFRQQVKKDRRFYSYGRDEKEREKMFRSYLKDLGEEKRNERKRAEEAFLLMLKEGHKSGLFQSPGSVKWADVKKQFQKDPRYDAVGSSTLREELFETFIKTFMIAKDSLEMASTSRDSERMEVAPEVDRRQRREKAVREREERVRRVQAALEKQNALSRAGLNLEEAELTFKTLLIDHVREPNVSFESAMNYLSADQRFASISQATSMSQARLRSLFQAHISHLQAKGSAALFSLFESYAPGLDVHWHGLSSSAKDSIANSSVAKRLDLDTMIRVPASRGEYGGGHDSRVGGIGHGDTLRLGGDGQGGGSQVEYPDLERAFDKWQRERYANARVAFDTMLTENAFVEFWGRVGKMGLVDDEQKQRLGKVVFAESGGDAVPMGEEEEEMGEGGGGRADLQRLAKGIDVSEVEKVLRTDKRYIVFDYMPEERRKWLKDYLTSLSAPKASVHVQ